MQCSTLGWSFCTIHNSTFHLLRESDVCPQSVLASPQPVWAKPAIFHPKSILGSHRQRDCRGRLLRCDTVGVGVGVKLGESSQQPRPPSPDCSARPLLWPHQGLPQCWSGHLPNGSSQRNCRCVLVKLLAPSPLHSCGSASPPTTQRTKTKSICPEYGAGATCQPPIQPWKSPQNPSAASSGLTQRARPWLS